MNVTALVDTSGTVLERVVYDPYGKATFYDGSWTSPSATSAYDNVVLYCGYRWDGETGLYHVRHRMYHASLGRWNQRDPIGYYDGMSLYQYVGGRPKALLDPDGLYCCGRDVTNLLRSMLRRIQSRWRNLDWKARNQICNGIWAPKGWDIDEMYGSKPLVNKLVDESKGKCPDINDEADPCRRTVTVNGECFDTAQVNYILWGKLNRLCGASLTATLMGVQAHKAIQTGLDQFRKLVGKEAGGYRLFAPDSLGWSAAGWADVDGLAVHASGLIPSSYAHCRIGGCQTTVKKLNVVIRKPGSAYIGWKVPVANKMANDLYPGGFLWGPSMDAGRGIGDWIGSLFRGEP